VGSGGWSENDRGFSPSGRRLGTARFSAVAGWLGARLDGAGADGAGADGAGAEGAGVEGAGVEGAGVEGAGLDGELGMGTRASQAGHTISCPAVEMSSTRDSPQCGQGISLSTIKQGVWLRCYFCDGRGEL
jgi:hypothetical protein